MNDLIYFPKIGSGIFSVWRRNYLYFRYTIWAAAAWMFLEPLLYISAFGYGLGKYVGTIDGESYLQFITPALIATSGLMISFIDAAYGTYTKLSRQNTYQTIILAPISPDEVTFAEILWCASKGFMSVLAITMVVSIMGLVSVAALPAVLVILFMMCWLFAALGVVFATMAKSYDWFIYSQSGLIIPMTLFSGTYFPLKELPEVIQWVAYLLPLTHTLESVRMFLGSEFRAHFFINFGYLLFVGLILTNVACARMQRKLIV